MIVNQPTTQKSRKFLYLILMITVGLTLWVAMNESDEGEITVVAARKNTRQSVQLIDAEAQSSLLPSLQANSTPLMFRREKHSRPIKQLFQVHSWLVPPPVQKIVFKPETPIAPPLPFEYNGKLEGAPQGTQIFLMANDKLYTASLGENVDSQWRLDGETEGSLQFTYLPLNLPKELSKSATLNPMAERPAAWLLKAPNN